jgi:hypothetical protein
MVKRLSPNKPGEAILFFFGVIGIHPETRLKVLRGERK